LAAPYLSPSGVGVFLKGREVHGEIDEASIGWRFDVELVPSMTDPHGRIVVVRNVTAKRRVEP